MRSESWEETALYACHVAQTASLDVKPWQQVPARIHLESALRQPFGLTTAERESAEIRLKLQALGLSRFEPDPLRAIAMAEERQTGP